MGETVLVLIRYDPRLYCIEADFHLELDYIFDKKNGVLTPSELYSTRKWTSDV